MSAELLFKAHGMLELPDQMDSESLRDELESVAADLMVDISVQEKP